MNADILLQHFKRISEAPDAIPHLRRFILDLAVRGKLVDQNTNDEPAADLLKRIQAEKARLVKSGEIRKQKPMPTIGLDELPFEVPRGWEWVRIRQITSDRGQAVPDKDFTYIDVTAINKEAGCVADAKVVSAIDAPSRARKLVQTGDVLYSCVRPYLLNIAVIENDISPAPIASTAFAVLNGFGLVHSRYQWITLRSPFMVECVEAKMRGQAYPAINDSDFALIPFPLPPLAEQHRIVAKVDELMALCDQLEAAKTEREQSRDRLLAANLHNLNQPDDDEEAFREHARFTFNHLPRITTRPAHIKQLRQTILNLAVRGKLVPQDMNEGTGKELLSSLKKSRAEWEATGRIRKDKGGHAIAEDNKYFKVPDTWVWARLTEIGQTQTGTSPSSANTELFGDFIPFVKPADLDGNEINYDGPGLSEAGVGCSRLVCAYSVLMVCIGATLGKVNKTTRPVCFNQQINSLTPYLDGLTDYIALALKTSGFQALAWSKAGTGTLPIISKGKWEILQIPLPPLAEQHRIVAKVDELMSLCDQLEAQLNTTQTDSRRLLEAVLHEALAPALEEVA